jgi:hypothetical protein
LDNDFPHEERPVIDAGDIVMAQDVQNPLNEYDFIQLNQMVNPDVHNDADAYGINKFRQALEFVTQHV